MLYSESRFSLARGVWVRMGEGDWFANCSYTVVPRRSNATAMCMDTAENMVGNTFCI